MEEYLWPTKFELRVAKFITWLLGFGFLHNYRMPRGQEIENFILWSILQTNRHVILIAKMNQYINFFCIPDLCLGGSNLNFVSLYLSPHFEPIFGSASPGGYSSQCSELTNKIACWLDQANHPFQIVHECFGMYIYYVGTRTS